MKNIMLLFWGLVLFQGKILSQEKEEILSIDSIVENLSLDKSIIAISGCDTSDEAGHKEIIENIRCSSALLWGRERKIIKLEETARNKLYQESTICFFDTLGKINMIRYKVIERGRTNSDRTIYVKKDQEIYQTGTGERLDANYLLKKAYESIERIRPTPYFPKP